MKEKEDKKEEKALGNRTRAKMSHVGSKTRL